MQIITLPMLKQDKPPVTAVRNLLEERNVKIKVRKKKVSVTEGRRFPQQLQRPPEKNHTFITHACAQWLAKILVLVKRAEEPTQHMALTEAEHWAALSTTLTSLFARLSWEHFKQRFHESYLLRALLIFHNPKVHRHLPIQAPANTTGAVIILQLHRLKTCKDGDFKGKRGKRNLLSPSFTSLF